MYLSQRIYKEVSGPDYSFSFKKEEQSYFYGKYHHHPEYEFTYIEKGSGIRFVGDHIGHFEEGEIVFLGPNLSHMWKCDPHYYENNKPDACCSHVIHFPKQLMENILSALPEMKPIMDFFEQSKRGIKIEGPILKQLIPCFQEMSKQSGSERFVNLLHMLNLAANAKQKTFLSQSFVSDEQEEKGSVRLNSVYNYLLSSIHEKITLEKVASVANMSPTAFCRFFKQKTGKSFTQILNEIRVTHACRLLIEGKGKVAQIAFSSGFTNLSHFNSQFKKVTGKTPKAFMNGVKKATGAF